MKVSSNGFWTSLLLKQQECKFSKQCNLFKKSSVTCMNEGGIYCGKYRTLNANNLTAVKKTFEVNPEFYAPLVEN